MCVPFSLSGITQFITQVTIITLILFCLKKGITSFIKGSSTSFQPADVINRNRSSIELGKVSKLTILFNASRCLTCINEDMPKIEKITIPKNSRTAMFNKAGIETISVIIKRRIPLAALITLNTRKIRNTRTTRNKVGETKKSNKFSRIRPIALSIMTMKSNTLNGSRK